MSGSWRRGRLLLLGVMIVVLALGATWVVWSYIWLPAYLADGREAVRSKDWPRAQRLLGRYLAWRPGATEAHFLIAEALAEQGLMRRALGHLKDVPDTSPWGASARWHEASLLLQLDLAAQAERAARRSLELDPQSLDARQLLTIIYRWENRVREAERLFWELYELCPPSQTVIALAQLFQIHDGEFSAQEALKRLQAFVANDPTDFAARLAIARLHVGAGNAERATELLEDCWRHKPGDPDARAALVNCHVSFGAYEKAARLLETWPVDQRDVRYWQSLGIYQSEHLQQFEQAAESFRRVLAQLPDDWRTRHRLGICLRVIGDEDGAAAEFERADRIRAVLEREQMEETLKKLPQTITTADGRYEIGRIYEEVGRYREARSWYQEALALDPEHQVSQEGLDRIGSNSTEAQSEF